MLFGTAHLDNPGLDEANPEVDDVLEPERQEEIRNLVERLADWKPERVAVERPYDCHEDLNEFYETFRSGERSYDYQSDDSDPDFRAFDSNAVGEIRSEVVQIVVIIDGPGGRGVKPAMPK